MTKKQEDALAAIIDALPKEAQNGIREVAEYAISLGYMPALKGGRKAYADFSNRKVGRTILKINSDSDFPRLSMHFFAVPTHASLFQDALQARLAYWNKLRYEARCFGCGKCDGKQGDAVSLSDGRQGFLCGRGVIPLPTFGNANITEVKNALDIQHEFFKKQAGI